MKNPFVILFVIVLSSCANVKHSNFNRQKFTHLKTRTVEENQTLTETKSYESTSEPNVQTAEKQTTTEQGAVTENSKVPETLSDAETINATKNEVNDAIDFQESEKPETGIQNAEPGYEPKIHSTDSESHSADAALSKFHLLFQVGLMLFIISALLFAMSWFATSIAMMAVCLIAADATILAVWIISFVLINTGRKIEKTDRDKRFRIEYGLAWFTACIGPLVGLGVIILGVIIVLNHF